jgi:hypothetical protein
MFVEDVVPLKEALSITPIFLQVSPCAFVLEPCPHHSLQFWCCNTYAA